MQATGVLSCPTGELSRADKCCQESRDTRVRFSAVAAPAAENCPHKKPNRQPGTQPADLDARSRMLLEKPIVPMIMRLAIPNATVMAVYVLT
jgi:hypothetical protein